MKKINHRQIIVILSLFISLPLKAQTAIKRVYTTFMNECYMYDVSGNGQIQKRTGAPDGCVPDTTVRKIITKVDEIIAPVITKDGSFDSKIEIKPREGKGYEALEVWIPKDDKAPEGRRTDYTTYFVKRLESVTPLNLSSVYFNKLGSGNTNEPLIKDQTSCVRTLKVNSFSFNETKMECTTINAELCGIARDINSGTDNVNRVQYAFKKMYGITSDNKKRTGAENINNQIAFIRQNGLKKFSFNNGHLTTKSMEYRQTIDELIKGFGRGESRQGGVGSDRYKWASRIARDVMQRCDKFFPPRNSSETGGEQTGGSHVF